MLHLVRVTQHRVYYAIACISLVAFIFTLIYIQVQTLITYR